MQHTVGNAKLHVKFREKHLQFYSEYHCFMKFPDTYMYSLHVHVIK